MLLAALLASTIPAKSADFTKLRENWDNCVANTAYLFAAKLANEPADVIVMGAYGKCKAPLMNAAAELVKQTNGSPNAVLSIARQWEDDDREEHVAEVLQQRIEGKP
ncbi:MAG: hypothetical protein E5V37_18490 [Mesorhizobium sp.]|nr:MAG: hypothetical protein E5V37_18490 [Mesorhizobium sp.]